MTDKLMPGATGVLALADGTILQGIGVGAAGEAVGEVCFNGKPDRNYPPLCLPLHPHGTATIMDDGVVTDPCN
jgi:hypothetical protein